MLIRQILMAIIGLSSGFTVAGGIFAFIVGLGIIPRFAGRTHTAHRILWYEDCVLVGGALGNLMYIYQLPVHLGKIGLGLPLWRNVCGRLGHGIGGDREHDPHL